MPENEFTYSKRDKAVADLFLDDAEDMCRVAYAIRAQRLDSRSSRWCSHDSQRSPLHQPAGPSCLGNVRGDGGWPARLARRSQEQPLLRRPRHAVLG